MRLFVAATPPAEELAALSRALDPVRDQAPDALRIVPVERWHLTLAFLGEVADERVDGLADALRAAVAGRPQPVVRISGGGAFGQVLWAGVDDEARGSDDLAGLARAVARAARAAGVDVERRPYRGHLSVARTRGRPRFRAEPESARGAALVRDTLLPYAGQPWTVREAQLLRSHMGPRPRHEVLATFPLADPTSGPSAPPADRRGG